MSLRYVFFRDDPSSHKEVYMTRLPDGGFESVSSPVYTNLEFATAREAYDFGAEFPKLQSWRVGQR